MSLTSKLTLGASCMVSFGIIGYVHFKQTSDREKLHEGVLKDIERQQRRKLENTYTLQQQIDLTKKLRKELDLENAAIKEKSSLNIFKVGFDVDTSDFFFASKGSTLLSLLFTVVPIIFFKLE